MKQRRVYAILFVFVIALLLPLVAQASRTAYSGPLNVNVSVVKKFDTTLSPGVWHGWVLGPSSTKRAYAVEITPLELSGDGAHIERYVVQPECDGTAWNDVLRIMSPATYPPLKVNVRVYALTP